MAQGHLTVGIVSGANKVRLTFDTVNGRFEFDMTVKEAGEHTQNMLTAVEHITGKKGSKLILPEGWSK